MFLKYFLIFLEYPFKNSLLPQNLVFRPKIWVASKQRMEVSCHFEKIVLTFSFVEFECFENKYDFK